MTLIWFVVWLVATTLGADKPLLLDPVNVWTGTLILAVAVDLAAANATGRASPRSSRGEA